MMANYFLNTDQYNSTDKKRYDFAKEKNFGFIQRGNIIPRDGSLAKLLNSPANLVSGFSKKMLSSDPNEFCNRWKLLLPEKEDGKDLTKLLKKVLP